MLSKLRILLGRLRWERASAESRQGGWTGRRLDFLVYTLILGFGTLAVLLHRRSDFYCDDYGYAERGMSMLRHGLHGFDGNPELVQPPGLPVIIAAISALFGSSYSILLGAMAVFGTAGLIVTYELLKREESRPLAAAVCLLLASSEWFFFYAAEVVVPCYPYILAASAALLFARTADRSSRRLPRALWAFLTTLLVLAALMIESRGIALVIGLAAWMAASFVLDRPRAATRLRTFVPVFIVGVGCQGWWMHLAPTSSDWPLPGYPASYLSQMTLKLGNFPELGRASAGDWLFRVGRNLRDGAEGVSEILAHHWIDSLWSSPAIAGIIVLALIGVAYSLWRTGGRLMDWYFLGAEAAFLLWSWAFEFRFLMPTTPFALVYVWRGAQAVRRLFARRPRWGAICTLALAVPLGIHSALCAFGLRSADVASGRMQADLSALFWSVATVVSAWIAWSGRLPFTAERPDKLQHWLDRTRPRLAAVGFVLALFLVAVGLSQEVKEGWHNLHLTADEISPPDVEGAKWIAAHTPPGAIVLASHYAIVYYHAHRRVFWFPPISRPAVLLEGIRKRQVSHVLVVQRAQSYYQPSDQVCFDKMLDAYPEAFKLVGSGRKFKVYEVLGERGPA